MEHKPGKHHRTEAKENIKTETEKKYLVARLSTGYLGKLKPVISEKIEQGYIFAGKDDPKPNRIVLYGKDVLRVVPIKEDGKVGRVERYIQEIIPVTPTRKKRGEVTYQIGLTSQQYNNLKPAANSDGTVVAGEVRIRKKGNKYYETIKGDGSLTREEYETEITPDQYQWLLPTTKGKRVNKTRFTVPQDNLKYEIDVYEDGHMSLEVELPSEQAANAFKLPEDIGEAIDVTKDKAYKNKNIALKGFPQDTRPTQKYRVTPSKEVEAVA